jgi:hypothetical protein
MAEPHVVAALKDKRAELSGSIADLEKRIGQHRADLLHVDAVLRLFAPSLNRRRSCQGRCVALVHGCVSCPCV